MMCGWFHTQPLFDLVAKIKAITVKMRFEMKLMNKISALLLCTFLATSCACWAAGAKCVFCGGGPVGSGCSKSPTKTCVVVNFGKCSYCGGGPAGSGCSKSPTKTCVVPSISGKCSYCGGGPIGSGCSKSPTKHCSAVQM